MHDVLTLEVIRHHLQIMGLCQRFWDPSTGNFVKLIAGSRYKNDIDDVLSHHVNSGGILLVLKPENDLLEALGITASKRDIGNSPFRFSDLELPTELVSYYGYDTYECGDFEPILQTKDGKNAWIKVRHGEGWVFLIGTLLAQDLTRIRQGDPAKAEAGQEGVLWGIAGERPNYLYEGQYSIDNPYCRYADNWVFGLARALSITFGERLDPILPKDAKGLLVITGDDDQAYLEKYQEQLEALDGLPITYFLHPLTNHTKTTISAIEQNNHVEWEIHPDALEAPGNYTALFRTQADWFESLVGRPARLVRNHGFLNDGYMGHQPVWEERNIVGSSNLPGVDGTIVNGSLLPARVVHNGKLSQHWSILTAIGDGVLFALGMNKKESADCIQQLANEILESNIPGVIVINLHPQNITESSEMHKVLHSLVHQGFISMTLGECIQWFSSKNQQSNSIV